jgi:hypothetical protein
MLRSRARINTGISEAGANGYVLARNFGESFVPFVISFTEH